MGSCNSVNKPKHENHHHLPDNYARVLTKADTITPKVIRNQICEKTEYDGI